MKEMVSPPHRSTTLRVESRLEVVVAGHQVPARSKVCVEHRLIFIWLNISPDQRKQSISEPFNFQHVTHTLHNHIPNLERTSDNELVSEFSVVRASQAPTRGELKGIQAKDLYFENFSSEALGSAYDIGPHGEHRQTTSPPRQTYLVAKHSPPPPDRMITHAQSLENIGFAPSRPPRSPMEACYPLHIAQSIGSGTPPAFGDVYSTTSDGPSQLPLVDNGGLSQPAPVFTSPKWGPSSGGLRQERQDYFSSRKGHSSAGTPDDNSEWPLCSSGFGSMNGDLADVPEEEETAMRSLSRSSRHSIRADLRASKSVPELSLFIRPLGRVTRERRGSEMSETLGQMTLMTPTGERPRGQVSMGPADGEETWEDDIDYCYEHAAEADCDYEWDRCSLEEKIHGSDPTPEQRHIHLGEEPIRGLGIYPANLGATNAHDLRIFRPDLLVPSAFDLPELSPMSIHSNTSSDPRTPCFSGNTHLRSPSHTLNHKGPQPFTLSPSLLVPSDYGYASAAHFADHDNDTTYEHMLENTAVYATPPSPGRSSFRISAASTAMRSVNSQESVILSRAASVVLRHRSIASASSLPELVPSRSIPASAVEGEDVDPATSVAALHGASDDDHGPGDCATKQNTYVSEKASQQAVCKKSSSGHLLSEKDTLGSLTPVAENFTEFPSGACHTAPAIDIGVSAVAGSPGWHGRKYSEPLLLRGNAERRIGAHRQRSSSLAHSTGRFRSGSVGPPTSMRGSYRPSPNLAVAEGGMF